jgi:hypothetical protein
MNRDIQKLLGPWTLEDAIRQRVDKEALAAWALKEDAPFKPIPPLKPEKWSGTALHVLKSQLWQMIA